MYPRNVTTPKTNTLEYTESAQIDRPYGRVEQSIHRLNKLVGGELPNALDELEYRLQGILPANRGESCNPPFVTDTEAPPSVVADHVETLEYQIEKLIRRVNELRERVDL